MFGQHTGTLRLWYQIGYQDWKQAWNLTGEQDTSWNSTVVMIPYSYMLSYYGFRYHSRFNFLRFLALVHLQVFAVRGTCVFWEFLESDEKRSKYILLDEIKIK